MPSTSHKYLYYRIWYNNLFSFFRITTSSFSNFFFLENQTIPSIPLSWKLILLIRNSYYAVSQNVEKDVLPTSYDYFSWYSLWYNKPIQNLKKQTISSIPKKILMKNSRAAFYSVQSAVNPIRFFYLHIKNIHDFLFLQPSGFSINRNSSK